MSYLCNICAINVRDFQKSIQWEFYLSWFHFKCSKLTNIEFDNLAKSSDAWYCMACLGSMFPFNHIDDDFDFCILTLQLYAL